MRILVGTDFSEQAVQAANAAAALANAWGESLVLAHVYSESGFEDFSPRVLSEMATVAGKNLKAEAKRLRETGVTVVDELMTGAPYECLVEKAKPDFVKLVVVSSQGRSAAGRWLLGSVSERVAEAAQVPTLVVREAKPIEDWTAGERPLRVLIACDLSPASDAALKFVKVLQQVGPCDITVGYVDSPLSERARLGLKGPTSLTANDPEVQRVVERDLNRKVQDILGKTRCKVVIEPNLGRPDYAVAHMAAASKADLVITGTHQWHGTARLWHASFSRDILHTCRTNVLCVPISNANSPAGIHPVSRVLVTTDFSKLGNTAIAQAFSLSRSGGVVHLLHVLPVNDYPNPLIGGQMKKLQPTKKEWTKLKRQVEAKLAELIPSEAAELGIESEIEVVEDREPAQAIVQAAERFGADAICLATHGHTGITSTLMGSVAQAVVNQTKRPVHLIKAE
ncbi:MAG: Universal stress protein family [Verrucomicrobia bacterium]|nr:Universal stress protein family [Verrucomicrobiota bacterium]